MLLKSLVAGFLVALAVIGILIVGWLVATLLHAANIRAAHAMSVTPVTKYYSASVNIVSSAAWIIPIVVVGAILVYAIHLKRR